MPSVAHTARGDDALAAIQRFWGGSEATRGRLAAGRNGATAVFV